MKANEAPKKVYLHLTTGNRLLNGKYYKYKPAKIRNNDKIIEYTRTDAFIEKSWDFIEDNLLSSNQQDKSRLYYEQFKNYMKGE